jgi:hypothetical protein
MIKNSGDKELHSEDSQPEEGADMNLENLSMVQKIKRGGTKFFSKIKKQRKKKRNKKSDNKKRNRKMDSTELKKEFVAMGLAESIAVYKSIVNS